MVERVGARAEIQLGIFDILHRGAADIGQAASGESDVDIVVRSRSRLRHLQGVEAGAAVDHVIVVTSPIDNRVVPGVAADIVVALSAGERVVAVAAGRSEEHTSELQSLMRISYAVFCLKKKNQHTKNLFRIYT